MKTTVLIFGIASIALLSACSTSSVHIEGFKYSTIENNIYYEVEKIYGNDGSNSYDGYIICCPKIVDEVDKGSFAAFNYDNNEGIFKDSKTLCYKYVKGELRCYALEYRNSEKKCYMNRPSTKKMIEFDDILFDESLPHYSEYAKYVKVDNEKMVISGGGLEGEKSGYYVTESYAIKMGFKVFSLNC